MVVWSGRNGTVDDTDAVVPGSSPLRTGVAVGVRAVAVTHVVLPRAVIDVAVVVVVTTVAHTFVQLPAACMPSAIQIIITTSIHFRQLYLPFLLALPFSRLRWNYN